MCNHLTSFCTLCNLTSHCKVCDQVLWCTNHLKYTKILTLLRLSLLRLPSLLRPLLRRELLRRDFVETREFLPTHHVDISVCSGLAFLPIVSLYWTNVTRAPPFPKDLLHFNTLVTSLENTQQTWRKGQEVLSVCVWGGGWVAITDNQIPHRLCAQ